MELTVHSKPQDFLAATRLRLEEREAANGLMLGIALRLLDQPSPGAFLATVTDAEGALALAAVMTPPHNLLLFAPESTAPRDALAVLCRHLLADNAAVPGVLASRTLAGRFRDEWTQRAAVVSREGMAQRIYELRGVNRAAITAEGRFRLATEDDLDVLSRWHGERLRPSLLGLIRAGHVGLWELDAPVSCAAVARQTTRGGTINLVFTPPDLRQHGYATACVASLCLHFLDSGWEFCCLHADLANPTSNSIYQKIGFRPVDDFQAYRFEKCGSCCRRVAETKG